MIPVLQDKKLSEISIVNLTALLCYADPI